jgi:hypothetical protein
MPGGARPKCLEHRKLPKITHLSKISQCMLAIITRLLTMTHTKFRHTTPGSGLVLVTKHKRQPISELSRRTQGAHLPSYLRHSLTPRWISPHLTLYAFPKAFLSKPEVPYPKPYKPRPYPAPERRQIEEQQQRSTDMSMQVVSLNALIVLRSAVRAKIKRRLKEAIRLIVTRGAAFENSRDGSKLVFRAEDVGADKWIVPDAL